ncbi:hypothetical protein V8E54_004316 [Elaphomyces granulatus]
MDQNRARSSQKDTNLTNISDIGVSLLTGIHHSQKVDSERVVSVACHGFLANSCSRTMQCLSYRPSPTREGVSEPELPPVAPASQRSRDSDTSSTEAELVPESPDVIDQSN